MYAFIIVVCLSAAPDQCIFLVEEPPLYYETVKQCEKNMFNKAEHISVLVSKDKEIQLGGECIYFPKIIAI